MNIEKLLEWGAIIFVGVIGVRWLAGVINGDLEPLSPQTGSVGGYTNITPVSGPIIVGGYYGGGWNGNWPGNGPWPRWPNRRPGWPAPIAGWPR